MTRLTLKEIFLQINSLYFRNRLKNVTIRWAKDGEIRKSSMAVTRSQHGKVPKGTREFLILISKDLKKFQAMTILTIFHELVHVQQWDEVTDKTCHGRKFEKRMKQLAARGAFAGLW